MTTENASEIVPVTSVDKAELRRLNLKSFAFGAYAATAVLAIYSLINMVSTVFTTALPYVAGGVLFITLTSIFLSIVVSLKKYRKGARKSLAVVDTYAALAVISVTGYFAAACVAIFQPGSNVAELWSSGALAAFCWAALFATGKYGGELFHGDSKSTKSGC